MLLWGLVAPLEVPVALLEVPVALFGVVVGLFGVVVALWPCRVLGLAPDAIRDLPQTQWGSPLLGAFCSMNFGFPLPKGSCTLLTACRGSLVIRVRDVGNQVGELGAAPCACLQGGAAPLGQEAVGGGDAAPLAQPQKVLEERRESTRRLLSPQRGAEVLQKHSQLLCWR